MLVQRSLLEPQASGALEDDTEFVLSLDMALCPSMVLFIPLYLPG